MCLYLCGVYECVNIPGLLPVGELYIGAYNVVLVLGPVDSISSSRSLVVIGRQPTSVSLAVLWVAKGNV